MQILVLNWLDPANPRAGGAEIHLREVFGRLARRGHDVTLVALGWPGANSHEVVDGITVWRVGGRHSYAWRARRFVLDELRRERFDVVVEDLNKAPLFTPRWSPAPCVLLVHHLFGTTAFRTAPLPVAAASWAFERPVGRVYRGVPTQVVSASTAIDLMRRGLRLEDLAVIHNGTAGAPDADANTGRAPIPTFLYLGRLERYKSVDLIIRAVARLRESGGPHVRLVIAGGGSDEPRLRARTRELGVGDAVTFAGRVSESEKDRLFREAWANVLTSPKEGWGITVLEAGSCGTPTIASDSPGLRDAVVDGRTGVLVPHGDVTMLADAMRRFALDRSLVDCLGASARQRARLLTWDRAAALTEAHLAAAVEGRDPSSVLPAAECMPTLSRPRRTVLVPRNGPSDIPFGYAEYAVLAHAGGAPLELTADIGAADAQGSAVQVRVRREGTSIAPTLRLDGWPISVEELVRRVIGNATGSDAAILGWKHR